jgi:hypothetical protein
MMRSRPWGIVFFKTLHCIVFFKTLHCTTYSYIANCDYTTLHDPLEALGRLFFLRFMIRWRPWGDRRFVVGVIFVKCGLYIYYSDRIVVIILVLRNSRLPFYIQIKASSSPPPTCTYICPHPKRKILSQLSLTSPNLHLYLPASQVSSTFSHSSPWKSFFSKPSCSTAGK